MALFSSKAFCTENGHKKTLGFDPHPPMYRSLFLKKGYFGPSTFPYFTYLQFVPTLTKNRTKTESVRDEEQTIHKLSIFEQIYTLGNRDISFQA